MSLRFSTCNDGNKSHNRASSDSSSCKTTETTSQFARLVCEGDSWKESGAEAIFVCVIFAV